VDATPQEAAAFAEALSAQLGMWSREEFAEAVAAESGETVTPSAISLWLNAKSEPSRVKVYAMERVLGLKPGTLSRCLGYLPVNARNVATVEDALEADSRIPAEFRPMVIAVVSEARKRR
jgi:transcriptional regulator with XRE-family HTH domain